MESIAKFEVGNIYQMRFITDSDLKPEYICVKRTEKSVTFERFKSANDKIVRRIKEYNGSEYVLYGNYSMAPSIKASSLVG
jgi:hypothetical protein